MGGEGVGTGFRADDMIVRWSRQCTSCQSGVKGSDASHVQGKGMLTTFRQEIATVHRRERVMCEGSTRTSRRNKTARVTAVQFLSHLPTVHDTRDRERSGHPPLRMDPTRRKPPTPAKASAEVKAQFRLR